MRTAILLLSASACTPWTAFPDVAGPGDIGTVTPGEYAGTATLEVRAFAGPVLVKRELCTTSTIISVDLVAADLLSGEFTCEFEELGRVRANFTGTSAPLPNISGDLDASQFDAEWNGWFMDATSFYAELDGTDTAQGLRLVYRGFVEADRVGPLDGSSLGG